MNNALAYNNIRVNKKKHLNFFFIFFIKKIRRKILTKNELVILIFLEKM